VKNLFQNKKCFRIVKNQFFVSFSNIMDIEVKIEDSQGKIDIDKIKFQKMVFLYNALDSGWSIKKRKDSYIFTKNHEGKKEIFDEQFLATFMKDNTDINKILS
jgi:hypothetical protein